MAGLKAGAPTPQSITVHEQSRVLEVVFSDGAAFRLPFELLRVYSPLGRSDGPRPGTGSAAGRQARRDPGGGSSPWATMPCSPRFPMGTTAAFFSWDYLYELGQRQDALWQAYLARLQAAGADRDTPLSAKAARKSGSGCASH